MARVWFVRPEHRLTALGGRPAYEGPLDTFIWPLDLGLHRFYSADPPQRVSDSVPVNWKPEDFILVEVTQEDLAPGSGYRPGFYSSPYSPREAIRRLGLPAWEKDR